MKKQGIFKGAAPYGLANRRRRLHTSIHLISALSEQHRLTNATDFFNGSNFNSGGVLRVIQSSTLQQRLATLSSPFLVDLCRRLLPPP